MELDKQTRRGEKQKYSTSKFGIGNIKTASYEEIMGKPCDVFDEKCNYPKDVKIKIGGGKKLSTGPLGKGR